MSTLKKILFLVSLVLVVNLSACASKDYYAKPTEASAENNLDDYGDNQDFDDYGETSEESYHDTFEGFNRAMYSFNDFLLLDVIKPVHTAYSYVVPKRVRSGLSNFTDHLLSPVRFVNALLQLDFGAASVELGSFIVNSVTSLGFADVAATEEKYFYYNEKALDLGVTLAVWGFSEGPMITLPFFGPRNVRDAFGLVGDIWLDPMTYFAPISVSFANAGLTFNNMDTIYIPYENMKKISVDPYIATRDFSRNYRHNLVVEHINHGK